MIKDCQTAKDTDAKRAREREAGWLFFVLGTSDRGLAGNNEGVLVGYAFCEWLEKEQGLGEVFGGEGGVTCLIY